MAVFKRKGMAMKVFYTYGTDPMYPFCGGWVEVEAADMAQAHAAYRQRYPDRVPGVLNCADYYTEALFHITGMLESGNMGAFCHRKIMASAEMESGMANKQGMGVYG